MTRQQKLDATARRKGYSSYYAYRNAQAKAEGYAGYTAKRRARHAEIHTPIDEIDESFRFEIFDDAFEKPVTFAGEHPSVGMTRALRQKYRTAGRNVTDIALEAARIAPFSNVKVRKDTMPRTAVAHIDDLDHEIRDFYTHDFPNIYAAGAKSANPNWVPNRHAQEQVVELTKEGAGALNANNVAARRSIRNVIPGLITELPETAVKKAGRKPIKGVRFANGAEHSFDQYAEMVIRSNGARAYNAGFLNAAINTGAELFQVSDGSGCGWTDHRDPEQANGKIVTKDQALSYPIAHPNCVRTFKVAPKGSKPTKGLLRRAADKAGIASKELLIASAKREAFSAVVHLAADEHMRSAAYRAIANSKAGFLQYKLNLETVARLASFSFRSRAATLGNVTDIGTHLPPIVSPRAVADDVMAWIDDFADGVEEMPPHVLQILGLDEQQALRVVGDNMSEFTTFYNSNFKQGQLFPFPKARMERDFGHLQPKLTSVPERLASQQIGGGGGGSGGGGEDGGGRGGTTVREVLARQAREAFTNWLWGNVPHGTQIRYAAGFIREAQELGLTDAAHREAAALFFQQVGDKLPKGKYLRFTFPEIGEPTGFLDRPRRITLDMQRWAKVTRTSIKDRGVVNHLSLNPNGLLRGSFSKDPETGFVTPSFRLIPPGPLHLLTRVNRGVKGNITSLSGEIRLITKPIPFVDSVTARFNLNLRKLGIETLEDARNLSVADLRKLSPEDLRGVNIAANLRLRGFNIFDVAKTFRMDWEDAQKLWVLTTKQIDEFIPDLKANSAQKKFIALEGGHIGPTPASGVKPVLRLVDPVSGDPFSPLKPDIPHISIPSSIKSVKGRRLYLESHVPLGERDRVAALRKAGDFSAVRHLRDSNLLTWDEVSFHLNMSISKAQQLYKSGTSGEVEKITRQAIASRTGQERQAATKAAIAARKKDAANVINPKRIGRIVEEAKTPPKKPAKLTAPKPGKQPAQRKNPAVPLKEDMQLRGFEARTALERQFGHSPINTNQTLEDWNQPSTYRQVQGVLRNESIPLGEFEDLEGAVEATDELINDLDAMMQPIPRRILAHRIVEPNAFGIGGIDELLPGTRFGNPGYSATSIENFDKPDISRTNPIRMLVDIPKETKGTWLGGLEDELLLDRDLTFEITKVDKVKEIIHVRVMPKPPATKPPVIAKTAGAKPDALIKKAAPKLVPKKAPGTGFKIVTPKTVAKAPKKIPSKALVKAPTKAVVQVPGKKLPPAVTTERVLKDAEALEHFQSKFGVSPLGDLAADVERMSEASGIVPREAQVLESLESYQADQYVDINAILRNPNAFVRAAQDPSLGMKNVGGEQITTDYLQELGRRVQDIDGEMQPLEDTVQVYREVKTKLAFDVSHPSELVPGQRFADPGFTSTSVTDEILHGGGTEVPSMTTSFTAMEFIVPRGTKAIWMGDWERELLLERNMTFEVVRWDAERGRLIMKVVPKNA